MNPNHDVEKLLERMAAELQKQLTARGIREPLLIGIHTGGVWVAQRLHALLELKEPLGQLDISFYRDDFTLATAGHARRPPHRAGRRRALHRPHHPRGLE